ncbi:MAG TPA: DUF3090 domain-containing protein [Mycobacteriales bacterium]|nr:DUF3090 domain-containing protein [Mycobacteriales bacterium]HVU60451.1 DUF3090 domain-containing protein [Mycobacteriales bacterium]
MAGREFAFDPPERFVAGTVGEPGQRTFFLQASGGGRLVSVALEKLQVSALAERLDELLDEVRRRQGSDSPVPAVAPPQLEDVAPLDAPVEEEFRVGTLALAWDDDEKLVIIEAQSVVGDETEGGAPSDLDPNADMLRVKLSPAVARAFAKRALRVVAAGRPPCPLCGNPLDPEGHICPRQNGHLHAG